MFTDATSELRGGLKTLEMEESVFGVIGFYAVTINSIDTV
jgi:hypothetical protein